MTAVARLLGALMDRVRAGVSLPELLCEEAVDALGVAGAGIALLDEDGKLVPLATAGSCDAGLETTQHDLETLPDGPPGEEPDPVRVGVLTLHREEPDPADGARSTELAEFVESSSVILFHLRETGSGALTGARSPATSITHLADAVRRQQGGSSTSTQQRRHFPWQ